MKRRNILVICSDQHHPHFSGYRGHPHVRTPNLDRLAAEGTVFTRAYCNSPVCTPSRMSFITGQYVHQCKDWMIGVPSDPAKMTWGKRLDQCGYRSAMYGKMDFCGPYQDGGFSESRVVVRRPAFGVYPRETPWRPRLPGYKRPGKRKLLEEAGPCGPVNEPGLGNKADIGFFGHDLQIRDWAVEFLKRRRSTDDPWALYVGLLYPHWPFRVPESYFNMYYPALLDLPANARFPNSDGHPALRHFQDACDFGVISEEILRRTVAAYQGMVTAMDEMIGEIFRTLRDEGLYDETNIIYTSDHGESLGEHGLFYKQSSYEASVGVPLILRGPDVTGGVSVDTPVSLVDMYPTIMEMAGIPDPGHRADTPPILPGQSWLPLTRGEAGARRDYAFSEFHGNFFHNAWYMLVRGDYKYTYYVKDRPTLFDMKNDPGENDDLANDEHCSGVLRDFERLLRSIVDPEAVDLEAKNDLGLIGPDGEDYTETLSVERLERGIEAGEFPPEPERIL